MSPKLIQLINRVIVFCVSLWLGLGAYTYTETRADSNKRIDVNAIKSTEITDRLSRGEAPTQAGNSKTGLEALKELLFDEMSLFTVVSALVLLVALIGAAVIISKRRQ